MRTGTPIGKNYVALCIERIFAEEPLGVMNLLPIPALDGGRLVFLIIEVIRGKRVPPEKEGYVHMVGMVCLLLLMVFVMFNDIQRIFL